MSTSVTADDIAALKADGDLRRFITELTANRPTAATAAPPPAVGSLHGPDHRPGTWPAGTRTDRDTCHPDCNCAIPAA
jgi:hypothetical protein